MTMVIILLLLLVSFISGYFLSQYHLEAYLVDDSLIVDKNKNLKKENKILSDEKSQLDLALQIELKTSSILKQQIADFSASMSHLKEELHFYQGVVNVSDKNTGILFQQVQIKPANRELKKLLNSTNFPKLKKTPIKADRDLQFYALAQFSITIVNKLKNKKYLKGQLQFELLDQQGNQVSEWNILDEQAKIVTKVKLHFRYFQKIDGFILLHKKSSISQIKLSFINAKKSALDMSQEFNWSINKDLNYVGQ